MQTERYRAFIQYTTILLACTLVPSVSFAAPRTTPFTVGETLDPGAESVEPCGPTDANCFPSVLEVSDEGTTLHTSTNQIDFVGSGVTVASSTGGLITVIIPGDNVDWMSYLSASSTSYSTQVGFGAGENLNGSATFNTAVGYNALSSATSSSLHNTAIGAYSLASSTSGEDNTAIGFGSLFSNTVGSSNTAIGIQALQGNTSGFDNVAIGVDSLQSNIDGAFNTAMGNFSLHQNNSSSNTAIGYGTLRDNLTGFNNTSIGLNSLGDDTTGSYNTAFGVNTLSDLNITANDGSGSNTALGYNTGRGIVTGINNTILGANVTGLAPDLSNNIIIADGSGNRRINVDATGNVGIGTTTPDSKLSIYGDGSVLGLTHNTNTSYTAISGLEQGVAIGTVEFIGSGFADATRRGDLEIDAINFSGDVTLQASSGGRVGIGTTSPDELLHVYGTAVGSGAHIGNAFVGVYDANSEYATFVHNSLKGINSSNSLKQYSDGTTYLNSAASKQLHLQIGGDDQVLIDSTGNVGIGTTTPDTKLSVLGQIKTSGSSGDGTNNNHGIVINNSAWGSNAGLWKIVSKNDVNGLAFYDNTAAVGDFSTNNIPLFLQHSTGNVGIGTTSPDSKLEIYGDASVLGLTHNATTSYTAIGATEQGVGIGTIEFIGSGFADDTRRGDLEIDAINFSGDVTLQASSGGNVGIGTSTPTAQLSTTGTVRFSNFGAGSLQTDANGNLSVSSDERLKDIEAPFTRGIEALRDIDPISYHWKQGSGFDTTELYTGFSAQNIQEFIPEAIGVDKHGFLTLSDRPLLATVINATKEQQIILDELILASSSVTSRISGDTFWPRLTALVGNFVDGVLTVVGIHSDEVQTKELCIGEVGDRTCITKERLDNLLRNEVDNSIVNSSDSSPDTSNEGGTDTQESSDKVDIVIDTEGEVVVDPLVPEDVTGSEEAVDDSATDAPSIVEELPATPSAEESSETEQAPEPDNSAPSELPVE